MVKGSENFAGRMVEEFTVAAAALLYSKGVQVMNLN
jgi:hypothetical protein